MKPCPVCTHKNLPEINRRLLAGEAATTVAKDNGVGHRAMLNHETLHIPATLRRGAAATRIAEAKDLFEELGRRYERFGGMELKLEKMLDQITQVCRQFERSKDVVRLIAVLREQRDTIKELRETGRAALEVLKLLAVARGIAEPPEGYHAQPLDVAQAARDLYGLTEMPTLTVAEQKALPPVPADAAPQPPEEKNETEAGPAVAQPAPVQSMKDRAEQTRREIAGLRITHDPDIERKLAAAKPVNSYEQLLARAHAEGRRLEVGEANPHLLGTDVDYARPEPKPEPPVPQAIYLGGERCRCPQCPWEGLLSNPKAYEAHWRAAHEKPTVN
jgi:hypothetical protein